MLGRFLLGGWASSKPRFQLDYKKLSQIPQKFMHQETISTATLPTLPNVVDKAQTLIWGSVFSFFAPAMEAVLKEIHQSGEQGEGLAEEFQGGSRRYGAMLEALCVKQGQGQCLVYDLADGFKVLLIAKGKPSDEFGRIVEENFASEVAPVSEDLFVAFLSRALANFFSAHVSEGDVVDIEIGPCGYVFVPNERLDVVLRDLKLGAAAVAS